VEIALFEARDKLPAIIYDRDVQDNEIYIFLDRVVGTLEGSLRSRGLRWTLGAK
jgi:hypothetical protein